MELYRTRIEYYEPAKGRNESHFLAAADGLQLVRDGGYAFHVAISAAYRIIRLTFSEREICELSEIDMFPVWSQWMVAIVQKNSPYRDVITYGVLKRIGAFLLIQWRSSYQDQLNSTEMGEDCLFFFFMSLFTVHLFSVQMVNAFVFFFGYVCVLLSR
uniref:Uncharacterized protein n=1 Tax=Anopheles culicifacies TaxID=139723 RepID=A0A182MRD3_9DIPT